MILTLKQIQRLEYGVTVLLAAFPSLYLLINYPPFFNGTDSICYLGFPDSGVPHYPLFYPMYCSVLYKFMGDGIGFVYAIILGQHIFYTLVVLYIAFYIEQFKRRILFLGCMVFAFRATVFVHGMYTEAPAIIAVGFMIGALLRICLNHGTTGKKTHYIIYAIACIILSLSRFAGVFLIFVLPAYTFFNSLRQRNLLTGDSLRAVLMQTGLSLGFVVAAQVITLPELLYEHAQNSSVYGQPGTHRILDALSDGCGNTAPAQVLAVYKNATTDTVVKCAFDIIQHKQHNELWSGAFAELDSLRNDFVQKGIITNGRSTDSYLNEAFRIYLTKPGCLPYKVIARDVWLDFFDTDLYSTVSGDCAFLLSRGKDSLPTRVPHLQDYMHGHYSNDNYNTLCSDRVISANTEQLIIPVLLLLAFLLKRRVKVPGDWWLLFILIIVTGCLCHLFTALVTVRIMRYIQPAEFMMYTMWCVLIAMCWPFGEDQLKIDPGGKVL